MVVPVNKKRVKKQQKGKNTEEYVNKPSKKCRNKLETYRCPY